MPKKTLQNFSIEYLSILNPQGRIDPSLEPPLTSSELKKMYFYMLFLREFDEKSTLLQRQGRMGTYASAQGQEAIHIGSGMALQDTDWIFPSFREQGVYFCRGVPATHLFLYYMGSEEGNRIPREKRILPFCVPCASQTLHAVGVAMAAKIKKESLAVMTYFGDGATSEGDLHEAMNMAAVMNLPVVFLCQNNQWAISTPTSKQFHSQTLAQRALAYGIPGLKVDGNDVLAVYQASEAALTRARKGLGPSFLECETYRMGAHTTADDPGRYRSEADSQGWLEKDPMLRFGSYLQKKNILQAGEIDMMKEQIGQHLKRDFAEAEAIIKRMRPEDMFTYLYQNMPDPLRRQWEEFLTEQKPEEDGVIHA